MTLTRTFSRSFRYGMGLAAIVICASAFAGSTKDQAVPTKKRVVQKVTRKPCQVTFGGSAIPEPCDRVGEFPSTASPMHIIGKLPVAQTTR